MMFTEITPSLIRIDVTTGPCGSLKKFPTGYYIVEVLGEPCPTLLYKREAAELMAQAMYEEKRAARAERRPATMFPRHDSRGGGDRRRRGIVSDYPDFNEALIRWKP